MKSVEKFFALIKTGKVKSCPFCGSSLINVKAKEDYTVSVYCIECKGSGPSIKCLDLCEDNVDVEEIVRLWNKREKK